MENHPSRYRHVSRRAILKASAGAGAALVVAACGNSDARVFAGAVTDSVAQAAPQDVTPLPTAAPVTPQVPTEAQAVPTEAEAVPTEAQAVPTEAEAVEATPEPAPEPTPEPAQATEPAPDGAETEPATEPSQATEPAEATEPTQAAEPVETTAVPEPAADFAAAVVGDMVIEFTYTQAVGGKNERPYVAVWIENSAGELFDTVSLWFEQGRRGERWVDHLTRWWLVANGGLSNAAVVTSATRQAGSYAVVWDGTVNGVPAAAGTYFVCVESAREEGPYSLVRQPVDLVGAPVQVALPDDGELSAVTVRANV